MAISQNRGGRQLRGRGGTGVGAAGGCRHRLDIFGTTFDSEISTMNSIFVTEADTPVGGFDTIVPADVSTVAPADVSTVAPVAAPFTTHDYELYGINPAFSVPAS